MDVLLGDVVQLIDAADFVNLHDVGVDQRGGGLGLELKPPQVGPVARQLRLEDLHRHAAFQPLLLGQIDLGHRPAAEPPQQVEIAQPPARQVAFGRRRGRRNGGIGMGSELESGSDMIVR